MDNGSLLGALAVFTIGAALLIAIAMFLLHNRDPKNREATKAVANDDSSAHTGVRGGRKPEHGQV